MLVHKAVTISQRASSAFVRYARDETAVTAVELGLVAAPFFWLLCGIMEVGAIFAANTLLDHGAMEASRRVRTLEFQSSGGGATDFKQLVCDGTYGTLNCGSQMYVDVQTYTNFTSATSSPPIKNGSIDQSQLNFSPGSAGSIVVAKVYYQWNIVTPFLGSLWGNMGSGKRLLQSAVAFRNEP